ncbi:MAG: 16S rRNA (adenine(1518)-N(6)/adenine(1519)-N(6))-dimethyltransferase RsmA [Pseudomonadota bacterium]
MSADQPDGLPPLREVVETYGIGAKKSLGQNFLFDLNLTGRIARAAGDIEGRNVLEVGPGPGGLTRAILARGPAKLVAIEPDLRCHPALEQVGAHYPGSLQLVSGDALSIDHDGLFDGEPYAVIANLPYNVGTQLLLNWLTQPVWPPKWTALTLMFQREVAQRIVAEPGSSAYGRLSVLAGWRAHSSLMFEVSPKAFHPPPKVTSAIVHLTPREQPMLCDLKSLERVTAAAFGQRRKMLRASLKPLGGAELLESVDIDPTRRGETLSVEEFVAVANAVSR